MYRNGGLFLEKIYEQDREYFQRELKSHENIRDTFSLSCKVNVPPADKIVYLLDIRTPSPQRTKFLVLTGFSSISLDKRPNTLQIQSGEKS